MTQAEYDESSPAYLMRRLAGYSTAEQRKKQLAWEIARWQVASLINMNGKQLRHYMEPEQFILFSWEKEVTVWTDDLIERCNKLFPKRIEAKA